MPSFSPMSEYKLTSTQVDLILFALGNVELSPTEDDERRKIYDALQSCSYLPGPYIPEEDPYESYCDI